MGKLKGEVGIFALTLNLSQDLPLFLKFTATRNKTKKNISTKKVNKRNKIYILHLSLGLFN